MADVEVAEKGPTTARCRHCRQPIEDRTFGPKNWEPDYDPLNDPQLWRHANGYAKCFTDDWAEPGPEIVVLCGSTRFQDNFETETRRLGLMGFIVLAPSVFGHAGDLTPEQCVDGHPVKTALDELHFRKIDLADRVLVINPGGYVGTSTAREIDYAREAGKPVDYLEVVDRG